MVNGAASSIPKSLLAEGKARVLPRLLSLPGAIVRRALTATPMILLEVLSLLASPPNAIRMPIQLEVSLRPPLLPPPPVDPQFL